MKSQGFSSWAVSFGGRVAAAISHGIGGGVNRVSGLWAAAAAISDLWPLQKFKIC